MKKMTLKLRVTHGYQGLEKGVKIVRLKRWKSGSPHNTIIAFLADTLGIGTKRRKPKNNAVSRLCKFAKARL